MVVTAALVVAGGASCLSLVNNNVRSSDAMSGGQSVVYKTESESELKSNKWETAETAFAMTEDSTVLTIDHAPRETDSFPMHRSGPRLAFITERDSALDQNRLENAPHAQQIRPQSLPVKEPLTKLVEFDAAPFPYDGGRGSYHDRRVCCTYPRVSMRVGPASWCCSSTATEPRLSVTFATDSKCRPRSRLRA